MLWKKRLKAAFLSKVLPKWNTWPPIPPWSQNLFLSPSLPAGIHMEWTPLLFPARNSFRVSAESSGLCTVTAEMSMGPEPRMDVRQGEVWAGEILGELPLAQRRSERWADLRWICKEKVVVLLQAEKLLRQLRADPWGKCHSAHLAFFMSLGFALTLLVLGFFSFHNVIAELDVGSTALG